MFLHAGPKEANCWRRSCCAEDGFGDKIASCIQRRYRGSISREICPQVWDEQKGQTSCNKSCPHFPWVISVWFCKETTRVGDQKTQNKGSCSISHVGWVIQTIILVTKFFHYEQANRKDADFEACMITVFKDTSVREAVLISNQWSEKLVLSFNLDATWSLPTDVIQKAAVACHEQTDSPEIVQRMCDRTLFFPFGCEFGKLPHCAVA